MRWALRTLLGLLALLVTLATVALLAGVYLLHAPQGLEWGYRLAASRLPGEISVERMSGRLAGPIRLEGVHWRNNGTDVAIQHLTMQWQPGDLLKGELNIRDLEAGGVKVHTPAAQGGGGKPGLPNLTLPLEANISHAQLTDVDVNATHLNQIEIKHASFDRDRLQVQQLSVQAPSFQATASGHVWPQGDYPVDATVQWSMQNPQFGTVRGTTHLSGDLKDLKVDQQLNVPLQGRIKGKASDVLGRPPWQAQLRLPKVNLRQLQKAWPNLALGGTVRAHGDLQRVQVQGHVQTDYLDTEADHLVDVAYQGDGDSQIGGLQSLLGKSGIKLTLHGSIKNLTTAPKAELNGTWQDLHWPLKGEAVARSDKGRFTLTGTLEHYEVHAEGGVSGPMVPEGQWTLEGKGTRKALQVTELVLHTLSGTITAQGEVHWQPQLQWDLSARGKDINPGVRWPGWPGRLDFAAHSQGEMQQGRPVLQATLSSLEGQLQSFPVQGSAQLKVDGEHYDIAKLQLDVGGNRLSAGGTLDASWSVHWRLDAPALNRLADKAGGELHGSGSVHGPRARPTINGDLSAKHLAYADYRAGQAKIELRLNLADDSASRIDLQASALSAGARQLSTLHVHGEGRLEDHHLQLAAVAPNARLSVRADGDYANGAWQGTLKELTAATTLLGEWRLAAPVAVHAAPKAVRAEELCLQHEASRACAQGHWEAAQGWHAQSRLRAIPLALFKPWLPGDVNLVGSVAADAKVGAANGAIITGDGQIRIRAALPPPGMTVEQAGFSYHPTSIDVTLDQRGLALRLKSELAGGGQLEGAIALTRPALPAPIGDGRGGLAHSLSGKLRGEVSNLTLLPALLPGVEHTQGHISVSLSLDGSPQDPQISGELRLKNGSAVIPALGISPDAIALTLHGDPQGRLHLDASLHTKGEALHVTGDLRYDLTRGLIVQLRVSGDKAQVMNTPEYHVMASPDLQINLAGHRIEVKGEVVIPEADLRPRDLSGAVSASDDVVIVSDEGQTAPADGRWQIYTQIRLRLGDFVKFNGFGLKGLISGALTLTDEPQHPTLARGELSIKDGQYKAYGQKLTIDRGQLLFFGGDVANPGLDIRAVRHIEQVTAGITVRGTLKSPQVQIFSEPAMSEGDALAYLVIGQPINQVSSTAQGQQLYGAALSLGLAGSGLLANQIGQRFGIQELTVESGGGFGSGALVIRHYLSPKLYISYGVGLVEHINVFSIRYQISRLWSLDADSGAHSGADLVYTLEME